jgi:hypothetical protein
MPQKIIAKWLNIRWSDSNAEEYTHRRVLRAYLIEVR